MPKKEPGLGAALKVAFGIGSPEAYGPNQAEAELLRAFRRLPARRRKALLEMID